MDVGGGSVDCAVLRDAWWCAVVWAVVKGQAEAFVEGVRFCVGGEVSRFVELAEWPGGWS